MWLAFKRSLAWLGAGVSEVCVCDYVFIRQVLG